MIGIGVLIAFALVVSAFVYHKKYSKRHLNAVSNFSPRNGRHGQVPTGPGAVQRLHMPGGHRGRGPPGAITVLTPRRAGRTPLLRCPRPASLRTLRSTPHASRYDYCPTTLFSIGNKWRTSWTSTAWCETHNDTRSARHTSSILRRHNQGWSTYLHHRSAKLHQHWTTSADCTW